MNQYAKQRGSILLIAIALIVVVSLLAVAFTSLYIGDTASSADHATSSQALFVAESGLSNALENFRTGTACAALNLNNIAFGNGTFTATGFLHQPAGTTLTAAINAAATTIPVASTIGYAPHGRILVEAEQIDYAAIVGNTFTGARRGMNGSTAAAHANGVAVTQNLCRIRSTGTVGAARRIVEVTAAAAGGATRSNFLDGGSVNLGTAFATLGSLTSPLFPAASTNVVIAAMAMQNTTTTPGNTQIPRINAGQMQLQLGAATRASNQYPINVGAKPGASPSAQNFSREMLFLLDQQANVAASPTYLVRSTASTNGAITGELKMVVINSPPSSFIRSGAANNVAAGGTNVINNQTFTGPAGDRVLVVAVQAYNNIGNSPNQLRTIPAGGIRLRKGNGTGAILAQNQFPIDLVSELTTGAAASRVYAANRSTSLLLVARDPTSALNQRYTLQVAATGGNSVSARAQVVTIGMNANVAAAVFDGGSVAVGAADTVLGNLASTLGAGEQVVIAGTQYQNGGAATLAVGPGLERLLVDGAPQSVSQYGLTLCNTGNSVLCDDFATGLLWRNPNGAANPTFEVRAQASGLGINAETKILAIGMVSGIGLIDWLEVFQ